MKYSILVYVLLLLPLSGCVTSRRIGERHNEKMAAWVAEHPGEKLSEETKNQLLSEAEFEVEAEVAKERGEAIFKGLGAAGHATSGNWAMAIWDLVGLVGIGVSALGTKGG